jgi:hypothetical protein
MADKRKIYEDKFDAQLKEWNAEITLFNAKADKANAEAKIGYYKMIETLQGKQDTARIKLQELRTADDDEWEDIRTGAENVWSEVTAAFQSAAAGFK